MNSAKTQRKPPVYRLLGALVLLTSVFALTACCCPPFEKYQAQTKTVEAGLNLKTLAEGAAVYYDSDHYGADGLPIPERQFPTVDSSFGSRKASAVPSKVPRGTLHHPDLGDWDKEPWKSMHFAVGEPHRYRYRYAPKNKKKGADGFKSNAQGDLDGDGVQSEFNVNATTNQAGEVNITPVFLTDNANELE